jgi:catechol 2,3-dioxygenase-like lactoylglutathione lyase family enzyme
MLTDKDVAANLAVKDLKAARRFYEQVLGLQLAGNEGEQLVAYRSGRSMLLVYESQFAGTNRATAVTWTVGAELDGLVRELKAKGVRFEHYDFPDMKREGDVHVAGSMKAAWFKDPDGNILSMVSG